jgi:hypothetical protein
VSTRSTVRSTRPAAHRGDVLRASRSLILLLSNFASSIRTAIRRLLQLCRYTSHQGSIKRLLQDVR